MGIVNLLTIFVLLGLVIGSLMFCRRVSERQLNNKLAKISLTALDRRISNTWDVVEEMDRFSDYPQVVKILCQSLRIDMDRLVKLDSKFPDINASLVRLKRKEEDLDNALVEIDKLKESARINPASEDESRLAEVPTHFNCPFDRPSRVLGYVPLGRPNIDPNAGNDSRDGSAFYDRFGKNATKFAPIYE